MDKTYGKNTPGGKSGVPVNPPSVEAGPADSGEGQPLPDGVNEENSLFIRQSALAREDNPFTRRSALVRTPPEDLRETGRVRLGSGSAVDGILEATKTRAGPCMNEAMLPQQYNALYQENTARSQNELALLNALKKTEAERDNLADKVQQLQFQIDKILKTNEELMKKYAGLEETMATNIDNTIKPIEYFTDEEELAKETEWIRKKNRKKRKMDTSLTPPSNEQKVSSHIVNVKKVLPPPPIIVDGIENFNTLHAYVKDAIPNFQIKVINDKSIKINVDNEECYRTLGGRLNDQGYKWHSYENKQNRPIKVMAYKLHHSCNPEDIIEDLRRRKFKILEAVPKLKYKTKQPLNMFMLAFQHDENVEKIYGIADIMGICVEIKPFRKSKLIPQCKRCQSYGHTQRYCAKEPRCVRCTGKHLTAECRKPRDAQPKCVHCGEGHPANYRGCAVAREIQKIKDKSMKKQNLPKQPQRVTQQKPEVRYNLVDKIRSYSQIVTGNKEDRIDKNQDSSIDKTLQQILEMLTKMDERIIRLEYSAKGAIPKRKNNA